MLHHEPVFGYPPLEGVAGLIQGICVRKRGVTQNERNSESEPGAVRVH